MSKARGNKGGAKASPTRTCGMYLAGAFVAMVAAGCIPAPGMDNAPYVLIPYLVGIVATGLSAARLLGASLWRVRATAEMSEEERLASVARRAFVGLCACLATCVGELFHMLSTGLGATFGYSGTAGGPAYAVAFVVLMLAATLCLARARQSAQG